MQQSTNIKMRAIALQKTTFWGLYEGSLAADEMYMRRSPTADEMPSHQHGEHGSYPVVYCQFPNNHFEEMCRDCNIVLTDHLVLHVHLAVLLHVGKVQGAGAHIHIPVQLGQLPHVPLQVLPLVPVEAPANLRCHVEQEEGFVTHCGTTAVSADT